MKNKIPTDSQIIKDVTNAFAKADSLGGNWVDCLPDYIDCDTDLFGEYLDSLSDSSLSFKQYMKSHYIGTLADGRNLFYTPHAMDIVLIKDAK
jgi:hypothetical protein